VVLEVGSFALRRVTRDCAAVVALDGGLEVDGVPGAILYEWIGC